MQRRLVKLHFLIIEITVILSLLIGVAKFLRDEFNAVFPTITLTSHTVRPWTKNEQRQPSCPWRDHPRRRVGSPVQFYLSKPIYKPRARSVRSSRFWATYSIGLPQAGVAPPARRTRR